MIVLAMLSLAVALAASVWTTAYAWTSALPELMWLDRVRRAEAWESWLDTIDAMGETLDALVALDAAERSLQRSYA